MIDQVLKNSLQYFALSGTQRVSANKMFARTSTKKTIKRIVEEKKEVVEKIKKQSVQLSLF